MDGRTALVVDDDPQARAAMSELLAGARFTVIEAKNGADAIHYLTSNPGEPAIIVTDLAMPDMTGWELINVLQAYARLAMMPVLVVSAVQLKDQPVREEGVIECFTKPLDARRFLAAVERHAVTRETREARSKEAQKKRSMAPLLK